MLSLFAKNKTFVNTSGKTLEKQKVNVSRYVLFHMKTRDCLKLFVIYCGLLAKMKVLLMLKENVCKADTKFYPLYAISHEN